MHACACARACGACACVSAHLLLGDCAAFMVRASEEVLESAVFEGLLLAKHVLRPEGSQVTRNGTTHATGGRAMSTAKCGVRCSERRHLENTYPYLGVSKIRTLISECMARAPTAQREPCHLGTAAWNAQQAMWNPARLRALCSLGAATLPRGGAGRKWPGVSTPSAHAGTASARHCGPPPRGRGKDLALQPDLDRHQREDRFQREALHVVHLSAS